jgi:hypothetical protein
MMKEEGEPSLQEARPEADTVVSRKRLPDWHKSAVSLRVIGPKNGECEAPAHTVSSDYRMAKSEGKLEQACAHGHHASNAGAHEPNTKEE